jgi:chromosome segregation ATPase
MRQMELTLENKRWTKDSVVKALKDQIQELQAEFVQAEAAMKGEVKDLKDARAALEDRLASQGQEREARIEVLTRELEALRSSAKTSESGLQEQLYSLSLEKQRLEGEMLRMQVTADKAEEAWTARAHKLDTRMADLTESHRTEVTALKTAVEEREGGQHALKEMLSTVNGVVHSQREEMATMVAQQRQDEDSARVQQLQKIVASLRTELVSLQARTESAIQATATAQQDLLRSRVQYQQLQEDNSAHVQQLQDENRQELKVGRQLY